MRRASPYPEAKRMAKDCEFRLPKRVGVLMIALTVCAGCSSKAEKPAPPPPGVTVAAVIQRDVPIRQEWVGTMAGNVDADIRPKVEGFLLSRLYMEGSYVEKGQPMFQLDKRQAQAAVEQATGNLERARAALAQAQIDVRRYTPLVAQKAVSQAELDKAQSAERACLATVAADQAGLDNAKLDLVWTTVTSPISGIAGVAKIGIGDLITPTTVMTTVSSVNPIYVDVNIAEQDYLRLTREKSNRGGPHASDVNSGRRLVLSPRRASTFCESRGGFANGNDSSTRRIPKSRKHAPARAVRASPCRHGVAQRRSADPATIRFRTTGRLPGRSGYWRQ